MKTCPYCGSEVSSSDLDFGYCAFCEMKIPYEDIQDNGQRKQLLPESQPTLSDLKKSTSELMRLSTVELLFLLKWAREERSTTYKQRCTFIRAMKQGADEFAEAEQYTFKEYERATRKCFVLENLVRERLGYYPVKLTDSYIQNLAVKMEDSSSKKMVIQDPMPLP
jgi:hypothetical protein